MSISFFIENLLPLIDGGSSTPLALVLEDEANEGTFYEDTIGFLIF